MTKPRVLILSGVPGSGKSTHASYLARRSLPSGSRAIVSADSFLPKKPKPEDFSKAHALCYREYLRELATRRKPHAWIIVDNTNLSAWEIAPYYLAAAAMEFQVKVRRVMCDPEAAWKRQTHGVPFATFCQMVASFRRRDLMPWWESEEVLVHANGVAKRVLPSA